jgi:hypothetical protein
MIRSSNSISDEIKVQLQNRGYPKDNDFYTNFMTNKFYGAGDRLFKTRFVLETLEENFDHKEPVVLSDLSIEHIMPQTLTDWWKLKLGGEWEQTHSLFLHTIGNLTLTAYNPELSNFDFIRKKSILAESHLELNKYFIAKDNWNSIEIEKRADELASKALKIWSYFGNESQSVETDIKGTTPKGLHILGQKIDVASWRDVLEKTLNVVSDLEPEKFDTIADSFPAYISKDKTKFKSSRELANGYFIDINLSAQNIQRLCSAAMETIELTAEEWQVEIE